MDSSGAKLDNLSQRFLTELERLVPRDSFRTEFTDRLIVTIPARHAEVGDLTAWLDGVEVTVGIGKLHHCHFEGYSAEELSPGERDQKAAEQAAEYIRDVLDDKVMLRVEFQNGRCLGFQSWYPEVTDGGRLLSGADEVHEYVWSHRIR